ncbi:MAG: filamentous hemagglutinin N-terminal domain-containing protein [Nostocales cyanobacterium]|nr:MAG: filamentous hemagglutinin N-terminal domain-containing protein [Nostocales cyanobacterium]TAF20182.1 MAG: filamentous hemagglutinin N-terminal domain-containing protein [Nostocales cyanobacterium]
MHHHQKFAYRQLGLLLAQGTIIQIAVLSLFTGNPGLAQITPDTTLGNQNSRVTTGVNIKGNSTDLIEGGFQRGSNLYHSFSEFNVNNGQRVYFANPIGIDNILSRVTGSNPSHIFGTLGVNGAANLFLLNPKGIIFGPNAQLDIEGSFLATTADSFVFPDGSEFSATNPQTPPLLTMSVPVGVQFGSQPAENISITNQGNLLTGKDLTLNAGNLDLQGTLQAGGNLTLKAQENLKITDSATNPFIAAAGGNLLVQGNDKVDIYALNHPNSGFYAGGNIVLKSENTISSDAHFGAGGNFRVEKLNGELGNIFSPNDPIIRATGDVSFDSYKGASLHILAGGSVNIAGDIDITGVDNTDNSLQEIVTLSDGTTIDIDGSQTPTLDIRAGVDANYIGTATSDFLGGFHPQNPTITNNPTNANININGNIKNPGGLIFLTNQYRPNLNLSGNIITKEIESGIRNFVDENRIDVGNGGDTIIESKGDITVTKIYSGLRNVSGNTGNAGDVIFHATDNIRVGATDPNNPSFEGAINASILAAPRSTSSNRDEKYNSGNSGNIQVTSTRGNITVVGGLFTNSTASGSTAGDTGDIKLQARQGKVEVTANQSGAIVTRTSASDGHTPSFWDTTGNAGDITIDAKVITIKGRENNQNSRDITSESTLTGLSGKITFNSQTPLELNNLTIGTDARNGKGGDIEIIAPALTLGNTKISTKTVGKGDAGNIKIITEGSVLLKENSEINTNSSKNENDLLNFLNIPGAAGNIIIDATEQVSIFNSSKLSSQGNISGNIQIKARKFLLDNSEINTNSNANEDDFFSIFNNSGSGNIIIDVSEQVSILNNSKLSSQGIISGNLDIKTGSLFLDNSNINTDSITTKNDFSGFFDYLSSAGNIIINAINQVSMKDSEISNKGNFGNIDIETGNLFLNNSEINTSSKANPDDFFSSIKFAGNIIIDTNDTVSMLNNSKIFSQGTISGILVIKTGNLFLDHSEINTDSKPPENEFFNFLDFLSSAGKINISAINQVSLKDSKISNGGNFGAIGIATNNLFVNNSEVNTNSNGLSSAGNININANDQISLDSSKIFSQGNNGYIDILTNSLSLTDGAQINSSLVGTGEKVGSVSIIAKDSLLLEGNLNLKNTEVNTDVNTEIKQTGIFTQISPGSELFDSQGKGNITINTDKLIINDDARISADSYGKGNAGNVKVNAEKIELTNEGRIISVVRENADGNSGNIEINSSNLAVTDTARISVSNLSTGDAGSIKINASESVFLAQQGRVSSSVRSTGTGKSGSIDIETNFLTADEGTIEVRNQGQGDAGDITIKTNNLLLRRQSKITANAGSTNNPGNGGSITINAKEGFVIAVPSEDSDIIANAFGGRGGRIKITANRVFGFQNQENLTSEQLMQVNENGISDISASSDVGKNGQVSLNTLNVDPTQGLTTLPTNLVDTSGLIAQECSSNSNVAQEKSEFVITGRGGLPPSPDDTLKAGVISPAWVVNNTENGSNNSASVTGTNLQELPRNDSDTLVEAVGMVRNANGEIVFTAQPTTATEIHSGRSSQVCHLVQGDVKP